MRTTRSPFAHDKHDSVVRLCEQALPELPGIDFLAFYDRGFHVFSIGTVTDDERRPLERAFRQLVTEVGRFDDSMRVLGTGELMRTVVQTDDAVLQCGHVFEEEFLVGATWDLERADMMDADISRLVTRIRQEIYLQPDQLPGGRRGPRDTPGVESTAFHTETAERLEPGLEGALATLSGGVVDVNDVHYLALYRDWGFTFSADVFGSRALAHWFGGPSGAEAARKLYADLAARLRTDLPELAYALRLFSEQPIRRFVLDVVAGAVYVYPLAHHNGFVIGVTVFQPEVFAAEQRLLGVVPRIAELLGSE
ncbi:hypothetical protein OIE66_36960 [Nonomuraea sp. NBC_01738]|uniref:hypothetical protein n=1 Tax=Nonomuraea sp. NBC_01738 TaxID=2976003 RepID=UPI002E11B40A|nr:hypothetical protein OIE66_36960 [Nonomuraea sp. NBC_01738]